MVYIHMMDMVGNAFAFRLFDGSVENGCLA